MKKIVSILLIFCLAFSAILFSGCKKEASKNDEEKNINIIAFGDSISAGYAPQNTEMYTYYNNYLIGRTKINEKCYSNLLAENLMSDCVTVKAKSYAESGDTTTDLISKFNDNKNYPDLLLDMRKADIITLCIGANNVLAPTLDNLSDLMYGTMTLNELESLLISGYEKFKNDYTNSIIPILTNQKAQIYVMTIYDPYKYASLFDINVTGSIGFDFSIFETTFSSVKSLAIEYLEKINDYIKTQKFENVFVVDVNASFENISKNNYGRYVNSDTSKINLRIDTFDDLLSIQETLMSSIYLDPHPTMFGQQYIASLFYNAILEHYEI